VSAPASGPGEPKWRGRLLRWAAATLVIAAIAHLSTVLVLARQTRTSAYARIAAIGHGILLKTFPEPDGSGGSFPYRDPAMASAFCLFDLRNGAVDVSLPVTPLDVAVLSVHSRSGLAVYALTNRSAVGGKLTLSIMSPAATAAAEANSGDQALRVPFGGSVGFVMVQALAALPGLRPAAQATAAGLDCRAAT
jgi:uncharacterized membrane protein